MKSGTLLCYIIYLCWIGTVLAGSWTEWTNGTCSTACQQTRTRICDGTDCVGVSSEAVECFTDACVVKGFSLLSSTEVMFPSNSDNVRSSFQWTDTESISASVLLLGDVNTTLNTSLDSTNKKGYFDITSSYMTAEHYGIYHVQLMISNRKGTHYEDMALYFQAPITISSVDTPAVALVARSIDLTVHFSSGSAVETEWITSENDSAYKMCTGTVHSCSVSYTYNNTGDFNITLVTNNEVSAKVQTNIMISVVNLVEGFNMTALESSITSDQQLQLVLKLDSNDRLPMGNLTINIDFGDNKFETVKLDDKLNVILATGYTINHQYALQGDVTIKANVSSELDSQSLPDIVINVCDDISKLSLSVAEFANTSTNIDFSFLNYTTYGFQYLIDYGDGSTKQNDDSAMLTIFDSTPWTHAYSSPGVYTIKMNASNLNHFVACKRDITIENPLAELIVSPSDYKEFPLPDGNIDFKVELVQNVAAPTNVSCNVSWDSYNREVSTAISFVNPFEYNISFTSSGSKNIDITCRNRVSVVKLTSHIKLQSITYQDLQFVYPIYTSVNMSLNSADELKGFSTNVKFAISLFSCTRLPRDTVIEFDFGDGSPKQTATSFLANHDYSVRGHHIVTVTIKNATEIADVRKLQLQIGAIEFSVDTYVGSVGFTNFKFNISSAPSAGKPTYELDAGDSTVYQISVTENPMIRLHKYTSHGTYYPYIIGTFPNFIEIAYLDNALYTDYNLSQIMISFETSIELPPGDISVVVSKHPLSEDLPEVKCNFSFGDAIDRKAKTKTQDITMENPLVFNYTYITLGYQNVNITCYNHYDRNENITIIAVENECFPMTGIFDRQYSNINNPLKLYTSDDVDLSSRLPITCADRDVAYEWKLYTAYLNGTEVELNYEPPEKPKGSFRFSKGNIPEGIYRVTLNVSLDVTYVFEPTFLQFERRPPFSSIVGGYQRQYGLNMGEVVLDAFTESYELELGLGGNQDLSFAFSCKRSNSTLGTLSALSEMYEGSRYTFTDCAELLNTSYGRGLAKLTFFNASNEGYAITVNVSVDHLYSSFTQLILVIPGSPPVIKLQCVLNCMNKYAVSSKSSWSVKCENCLENEVLYYSWRLYMKYDVNWIEMYDLSSWSDTGTTSKDLVIKASTLNKDTKYRLVSIVSGQGRKGHGESASDFFTNVPPYGGECKAYPPKGNASTTSFKVECTNWLDEGENPDRNETRDKQENVPLKYKFLTVTVQDDDGTEEAIPFQYSGEMTATEIKFAQGDPNQNFTVILRVGIYDMFGDFNVTVLTVISEPPMEYVPTHPNDVSASEKLFDDFGSEYKKVDKGGNTMAVMRLIESSTSLYSNLNLPTKSTPDTSTPMKCVYYNDEDDEESSVKTFLRQKTDSLIDEIESKIPPDDYATGMSPSDATFVAKTVRQMITNKALFTNRVSRRIAKSLRKIMKNIRKIFSKKPFPLTDVSATKKGIEAVSSVIVKVLNFWKTSGKTDLKKKYNFNDIKDEFMRYYNQHPEEWGKDFKSEEDFDEKVQTCLEKREKIQEKQIQMANETAEGASDVIESTEDALDSAAATVSPGEGVWENSGTGMLLSVEKDSKDTFLNKTVKRKGLSLQFDNSSLSNITEGGSMELQVTVFDDSPLLNASEGSRIGQVMNIAVKDEHNNKVSTTLNMKIRNHAETHFAEYKPFIDPEDPDKMMYFKLYIEEDSTAMILYLKLEDSVMESIRASELYTFYAKSGTQPSSVDYDFKTVIKASSYETFGFKVFIREDALKKGDIFVALKPMEGIGNDTIKSFTRVRRSAELTNETTSSEGANATDLSTVNISMVVAATGCRVYDAESQIWRPNGCSVLSFSTLNETACRCPPAAGAIFSLSFAAPNMIDFSGVWSKFDPENAAVYGTMIGILVLYFIFVVVLRRYDKKDTFRSIPTFMCDNQQSDGYYYMIAVHTGLRPGAGTKSNVCFVVSGETGDSGVRLLSDGQRRGFETNTVTFYIMSSHVLLGDLSYVRIWHDNSGEGNDASWYLHKIVVTDLQTDQNFVFHCDKWLALDMDDGLIDRTLAVLSNKDCEFETAFSQQSRSNVTENHLWLSLAIRPQKNSFTRVQRLSCILMLLFLTMITNAMFYKSQENDEVAADTVQFGTMRLSLKTVWVSFIGCIITVPPLIVVTNLFRNATGNAVTKKVQKDSDKFDNLEDNNVNLVITYRKKFPHWVTYIAWIIVALAVMTSSFFLLLYSMQWGKAKSEEWITSFVLSFLESIFLVDPFKVIFLAILVAFIMRKPIEEEKMTINLDSVKKQAKAYTPKLDNQFMAFRMQVMAKEGPPSKEAVARERKMQMKMKEAKRAFTLLLLHIFFAANLFCISYINRDQRGYTYKNHIDKMLFESSKYQYGFNKISSYEGLFNWTEETLVPLYYPTSDYNGQSISIQEKFYIGDLANLRLGLVRMRQIRVKKDTCFTKQLVPGHFCSRKYDSDTEEKSSLCKDCQTPLTTKAWKYIDAKDIWGIPIIGEYNTYGGGGYIQTFSNNKANTIKIIDELKSNKWLDRLTRAVFVEFALYNANINVICYSIFLAEFPEIGGALTWVDTQCFRPSMISSATGALSLLLGILFLLLVIVRTVNVIKCVIKQKTKFFFNFWNILDLILILLSFIGVGMWVMRFIYTRKALNLYYNNKNSFINFQHIVVWDYAYNVVIACLVFIATLRVSSALGYNKRITEIAYVLKYGSGEIVGFGFQFLLIFCAFVIFAYLMFGLALYEYRNLFVSLGSLLNTIIGRNTLGRMKVAVPIFAELYFFVYVFFVVFTLLTMFAAILNNTIVRVRGMTKKESAVGITDVIFGTCKDMLGLFGVHVKNKKRKRKTGSSYTAKYCSGSVNTPNVVSLMRETLTEALDDNSTSKKEDKKSTRDLLKGKVTSERPDYNRENLCTPRQIHMEIDNTATNNVTPSYLML